MFAGALLVLLAGWILWLGPSRRLHRALALFLWLRATLYLLLAFGWDVATDATGRMAVYVLVALPFAALNLALVFMQEHLPAGRFLGTPTVRVARWTLLAAVVVFEAAYLVDHSVWVGEALDGGAPGWLALAAPLGYCTYALLAFLAARAALHSPQVEMRRALGVFALGFAAEPAFQATWTLLLQSRSSVWDAFGIAEVLVDLVAFALVVGVVAILVVDARPSGDRILGGRRGFLVVGAAVTSAFGLEAVFRTVSPGSLTGLALLFALDALWVSVLAVLVVYATLMHHLFDLDLKAKVLLNGGTFAAALGFVLVLIGEALERVLPVSEGGLAILLAVLITIMLKPAHVLARRVAEAAFPGVERTDDYVHRRRVQVYRAALEGAYRDGDITRKEREVLDTLRAEVGLDEKAATHLERRVRERLAVPRPGPSSGVSGHPPDDGLPKPP